MQRYWFLMLLLPGFAFAHCAKLNTRWLSKYQIQFAVELERRVFACEDEQDFKIAQALDDLYETDGERNFYEVARRLIHKIRIAQCDDPLTSAHMDGKNVLTLCPAYFKQSRIKRAAILFHEAAHGREKDPGHVLCDAGEAKGRKTCDGFLKSGYDGSGHNWEVHLVRYWIQTGEDAKAKADAREYLNFLLDHRINGLDAPAKKSWLEEK